MKIINKKQTEVVLKRGTNNVRALSVFFPSCSDKTELINGVNIWQKKMPRWRYY